MEMIEANLEGSEFRVYTYGSDVFIELKNKPGTKIRVSTTGNALHITASGCIITPTSVNGLDAFRVTS